MPREQKHAKKEDMVVAKEACMKKSEETHRCVCYQPTVAIYSPLAWVIRLPSIQEAAFSVEQQVSHGILLNTLWRCDMRVELNTVEGHRSVGNCPVSEQ